MPTNAIYREMSVAINTGNDSNQAAMNPSRKVLVTQDADQEEFRKTVFLGAAASETTIDTGIANIKSLIIMADYPIRYRLNGAAETQFVLNENDVANIACGQAPLDVCFFAATANFTELRIQPITDAAQTARVTIIATGDPATDY